MFRIVMKECYLPDCPDYFFFTIFLSYNACVFFFFSGPRKLRTQLIVKAVNCSIESADVY